MVLSDIIKTINLVTVVEWSWRQGREWTQVRRKFLKG